MQNDDAIFMDTGLLMMMLRDYLGNHGVRFIQRFINDFSQIDDDHIINCTGLGAAQLNQDTDMRSGQGHLILLKDQNPRHMNYMMSYSSDNFGDISGVIPSDATSKRFVHMFPKHFPGTADNDIGVIGGTYIEGATDASPNDIEFERVIARAKAFYGV